VAGSVYCYGLILHFVGYEICMQEEKLAYCINESCIMDDLSIPLFHQCLTLM